jgi:hypothetical protein
VCTRLSGEPSALVPTVGCAISGQHMSQANGHQAAPDCPVCTRLSGVHQTVSGGPKGPKAQWSASPEKERNRALFMSGGALDCSVRQPIEGKNCLPNGVSTAPSYLGAIKGTPRHMEHNTKPPLNILRHLDSASTHLDLRV